MGFGSCWLQWQLVTCLLDLFHEVDEMMEVVRNRDAGLDDCFEWGGGFRVRDRDKRQG